MYFPLYAISYFQFDVYILILFKQDYAAHIKKKNFFVSYDEIDKD